jgi:DNA-binding Lrp family transcriptional regulator
MSQKLLVRLSEDDRAALEKMTRSGTGKAREITRARIVLMADRNQPTFKTQAQIADALGISPVTVCRVCRRFAGEGRETALVERPRPGQKPKITGEIEARLVALACSDPPQGKSRWTVRLLRDELVRLEVVPAISHVAIHQALKKTNSNPGV